MSPTKSDPLNIDLLRMRVEGFKSGFELNEYNLNIMSIPAESKPMVKATDMEPEELTKVLEIAEMGLKESLKEQRQEKVLAKYLKT